MSHAPALLIIYALVGVFVVRVLWAFWVSIRTPRRLR